MVEKTPVEYLKESLERYEEAVKETYENNKSGKFAFGWDLHKKQIDAGSNLAWAAKKVLDNLDA